MAAPLGFKTFTTGEVLTAADTNGYLMQGIWTFANATARDAAVTSPQEGNTCYLKDTDVIQVYSGSAWVTKSGGSSPLTTKGDLYGYSTTDARVAVGTNGTVLTADSTAATGVAWSAAGGMTLISTTTISNNAQVNLTSIPATYRNLCVVLRNVITATDGASVQMRFQNDGTANRYYSATSWARVSVATAFNNTDMTLTAGLDNAVSQGLIVVDIPDYTNTTTWKRMLSTAVTNDSVTTTSFRFEPAIGIYNQTGAISELNFIAGSGNLTSGSILLYGVK